jgi:hypothetical protein
MVVGETVLRDFDTMLLIECGKDEGWRKTYKCHSRKIQSEVEALTVHSWGVRIHQESRDHKFLHIFFGAAGGYQCTRAFPKTIAH